MFWETPVCFLQRKQRVRHDAATRWIYFHFLSVLRPHTNLDRRAANRSFMLQTTNPGVLLILSSQQETLEAVFQNIELFLLGV